MYFFLMMFRLVEFIGILMDVILNKVLFLNIVYEYQLRCLNFGDVSGSGYNVEKICKVINC